MTHLRSFFVVAALVAMTATAADLYAGVALSQDTVQRVLKDPNTTPSQKIAALVGEDTDTRRLVGLLKQIYKAWQAAGQDELELEELSKLIASLEKPTPDAFQPGTMTSFYCYVVNDPNSQQYKANLDRRNDRFGKDTPGLSNPRCDSTIDAYAYSAYWMNTQTRCWRLLENMRYNKGYEFRTAVQDYLERHQGKEACVKTPAPRCQLAYCGGADDDYGIAFRPAVEFAAGAGTGLGFENNNNVGFTLAASLGARLFWWKDRIDIRLGIGIAAIPIGEPTEGMEGERTSRSAFMFTPGVGFFNGLFGISGIFLFDPGGKDRTGKGLGLTVDIVSIKNITGK